MTSNITGKPRRSGPRHNGRGKPASHTPHEGELMIEARRKHGVVMHVGTQHRSCSGGGELANNGPHLLDICRWGLGADHPLRVTATGGRFRYDDDQETPDTLDAVFDERNKPIPADREAVERAKAAEVPAPHMANFAACIRDGKRPNADVEEGHKSTLLCHLGNIAYRTGQVLECDPTTGRPRSSPAADALWSRDYRPGWEPVV